MPIEELLAAVSPPKLPMETGDADAWLRIQQNLTLDLPSDLLDFASHYGSGEFSDGSRNVCVRNPFSIDNKRVLDEELMILQQYPAFGFPLPYQAYPARPGLFPWARDANGHKLYWLTDGPPEKWPIILMTRDRVFERWQLPMTTFLAQVFSKKIRCVLWPRVGKRVRFKPIDHVRELEKKRQLEKQ